MTEDQIRAGLAAVESEAAALRGQAAKGVEELAPNLMAAATRVSPLWSGRLRVAGAFLAIMLITAGGAWLGHWLTPQPVHEDVAPAPMVRQSDDSVIAERAPASAPLPAGHVIPKGFHEVRRATVVIAPASAASSVEVDLSLVRNGTEQRVIASSPDGQVIRALDIPIEPALLPPAPRPWAAGLGYTTEREVGVWVERDLGRLRVGAEVLKGQGRPRAEVRVGVAF